MKNDLEGDARQAIRPTANLIPGVATFPV